MVKKMVFRFRCRTARCGDIVPEIIDLDNVPEVKQQTMERKERRDEFMQAQRQGYNDARVDSAASVSRNDPVIGQDGSVLASFPTMSLLQGARIMG